MDYANGKIYKITGGGMTYYGSTTQPLYKRFHQHKKLNCSSKNIIETGEAIIVLVELFSCKSKEELFSRERWFIENNECVNKNIPTRTDKEYRIDNANKINERHRQYRLDNNKEKDKQYRLDNIDKINERDRQYRQVNRDKINENHKEKMTCECGAICRKYGLSRHIKTEKHKLFLLK